MHPDVSDLPGLLLLVILAVHSAVDHETTWAKIRQVGYPWKGLSKNILVLQSSCLWVRWGGKEPNLQNLPLAAFYHFGASWKAVVARSVTLEQRQIKGWSWWQNWPTLCALQLVTFIIQAGFVDDIGGIDVGRWLLDFHSVTNCIPSRTPKASLVWLILVPNTETNT